jgi:acetolactate synthase-1/2/3 large subunit
MGKKKVTVVIACYNEEQNKVIYLNNSGYLSMRQTQDHFFQPPLVGCVPGSGLSFPDMSKLAPAYGIAYYRIDSYSSIESTLAKAFADDKPALIDVVVDPNQNFEPKLSSKSMPDGTIVSPEIDDMYPFLSKEEYLSNKLK